MINKFIYILILVTTQVYSQSIYTQFYTANNGLLSNNVSKVYLDSKGELWVGSRAGLSKKSINGFDKIPQALQYKFNNIFDIKEDHRQGMWIAGYGQGLLYFNKEKTHLFQEKEGLASNKVRCIEQFGNRMYIGTLSGLSIIDLDDFSITNPTFPKHPNFDFTVTSFFKIGTKIYATTLNNGIFQITERSLIKISDCKKVFSSFLFQNKLYIGTEKELLVLNPKTFAIIKKYPIASVWQYTLVDNQLYFVSSGVFETIGGIFRLENDKVYNISNLFNIPFYDLQTLVFHPDFSFFYVGSFDNGLVQIQTKSPVTKLKNVGKTYTIDSYNNVDFIFHEKGLSLISQQKIVKQISNSVFKDFQIKNDSKYKKNAVKENHFYPIDYTTTADEIQFYQAKIYNQKLWVASNIGFFILSLEGDLLNYYPVHVFCFDFLNNKLITPVPYGGVRIFDDIHTMDYTYFHDYHQPSIPAEIVDIVSTNDAVYFASALSGLYEYKNGNFQSFLLNKTFTEAKIKRITLNAKGNLYVVTDFNDVYELSIATTPVKIIRKISYDKIKGSSASFVQSVDGLLFIGTNEGLNVFSESKYYFLDKEQGLLSYNNNVAKCKKEEILIGGKEGVFILQSNYFNIKNPKAPQVELQKLMVNNEVWHNPLSNKSNIILKNTENNLLLKFELLGVKFPGKVKVFYRLKKSLQWVQSTSKNQIQLNYLESGTYDIQLKIIDLDQGEEYIIDLVTIKISPPFYLQWSFVIVCILISALGVILIYQRKLKNQQKKQEIVRKQLEYEKQLSDVKLQALKSQMNSHFLFNVLNSIQYFILIKDFDNALYYLERFSNLIRTTLEFSDKKSVSLYEELAYLEKYIEIENLRKDYKVVLKQSIHQSINLSEIQIVPLLLQPFVENAMIHAFPPTIENPEISIEIKPIEEGIQIIVADNGVGYLPKTQKHQSKGISIVQKRLELTQKNLKKELVITSNTQGTRVVLVIDGI